MTAREKTVCGVTLLAILGLLAMVAVMLCAATRSRLPDRTPFIFECNERYGWHVLVFGPSVGPTRKGIDKAAYIVVDFKRAAINGVVVSDVPFEEGWAPDQFVFRRDSVLVPIGSDGAVVMGDRVVAIDVDGVGVRCRAFFVGDGRAAPDLGPDQLRELVAKAMKP